MRHFVLLSFLILSLQAVDSRAQFTAERVATGLSLPIYVTAPSDDPADDRLFVVQKGGLIRVIEDGVVLGTEFLDLSTLVSGGGEQGLLGLAFAPDYADSGLFYVNYTNLAGDTVIARYSVSGDPNVADSNAEILMTIDQTASNHNGGHLAFSPEDGFLYIGMGDGGGNRTAAQDTSNPLGAMLRIDVSQSPGFAIPDTNPEFDDERIWSYGLRNPYRWSFDRQNGDLLIGDVGQVTVEEVDYQPASSEGGENYGWPITEGSICRPPSVGCDTSGLTPPVMEYRHDQVDNVRSVTGGYRYRGPVPELQGIYFFADFGGALFAGNATGPGEFSFSEIEIETDVGVIGGVPGFGEDAVGNVYLVDFDGEIFRLTGGVSCPEEPLDECRSAASSGLKLKSGGKPKLGWKWKKGEATSVEDFGDPALTGAYLVCIYDDSPSALAAQLVVPSGASWTSGKKGSKYKDKSGAFDGVRKAKVKSGSAGKASIKLAAKGESLSLPPLPVDTDGDLIVQMSSTETGACWESRFGAADVRTNESEKLKAKRK